MGSKNTKKERGLVIVGGDDEITLGGEFVSNLSSFAKIVNNFCDLLHLLTSRTIFYLLICTVMHTAWTDKWHIPAKYLIKRLASGPNINPAF